MRDRRMLVIAVIVALSAGLLAGIFANEVLRTAPKPLSSSQKWQVELYQKYMELPATTRSILEADLRLPVTEKVWCTNNEQLAVTTSQWLKLEGASEAKTRNEATMLVSKIGGDLSVKRPNGTVLAVGTQTIGMFTDEIDQLGQDISCEVVATCGIAVPWRIADKAMARK